MKSAEEIYIVSLLLVAAGTNINNTEKRVNNRKSLGKDQLEGLKKINPMWTLDENDVTIKR